MITPKRLSGSGPKKDTKAPCIPCVTGRSEGCCERVVRAFRKPPLLLRTVAMTATMPKSMMMPCTRSFTTVAMYPPRMT